MRITLSTLSIYLSLRVSIENAAAALSQSNHQSDQKTRGRDWDIEGLEGKGFERESLKRGFEEIFCCLNLTKKHLTMRSCKTLSEFSELGFFSRTFVYRNSEAGMGGVRAAQPKLTLINTRDVSVCWG